MHPARMSMISQPRAVIIGGDAGWRACIAVLLRGVAHIESRSRAVDAFPLLTREPIDCAIVDVARDRQDSVRLLREIGERYPRCAVLVTNCEKLSDLGCSLKHGWNAEGPIDEVVSEACQVLIDEHPGISFSEAVRSTVEYVAVNYPRRLPLSRIAAAVGWSSSAIAHAFPKVTGLTLGGFLRRARLEAALELLVTTEESQEDIALRVGLAGSSHLSRSMMNVLGGRPTCLRRAYRARDGVRVSG
jgi:AraC-like DNA-binding protein